MTLRAYSFKDKKMMDIVSCIEFKKYVLPNGNTAIIVTGKTKTNNNVAAIMNNLKEASCKKYKKKSKTKSK